MNKKYVVLLFVLNIVWLSGCATLTQVKGELVIRDPDNGVKLVKVKEHSTYDVKNQLKNLWVYASFSADVYLPIGDSKRLIKNDTKWVLYCASKKKKNDINTCKYKNTSDIGLEYEVWVNQSLKETLISFRGTDFSELEDWKSNLRWFISSKEDDQYDFVGEVTPKIIQDIKSKFNNMSFVTTGHSLGGGLAQRAAYSSKDVKLVYAFDPSMVTGFFDVFSIIDFLVYDERKEVNIYRSFEHGEVLAYPRWVMKILFPISNKNPRIAELRFNYIKGDLIAQHSIRELATELRDDLLVAQF